MKKNTIMRIAAVVLMCTLVTACFASSTFAKYTSQAEGTATATVAKWSFKVNDTQIATESQSDKTTVTFNLFDTAVGALDTKTGAADTDIVKGKIAPGSYGQFKFNVQNLSEVRTNYAVKITPTLNGVPIKFYKTCTITDGKPVFTNEITDYTVAAVSADLDAQMAAATDTATIYWVWDYGENVDDNALGVNTPTVSVLAEITATQID